MEEKTSEKVRENNQMPIVGAIVLAGALVAGAILLRGSGSNTPTAIIPEGTLAPVTEKDMQLGNPKAKVALVLYEDYQCPFCGAIFGTDHPSLLQSLKQREPGWAPFLPAVKEDYVKKGTVLFVYRDWAFLGTESIKAAEAARCAGDQNKFWEYHDYLYTNQKGENEGAFSDLNLKSFAKTLNLNSTSFDKCLDESKYAQAVADSRAEGSTAGVTGTPKGFILKNGKIVSTINGAESYASVKLKIDAALK